MTVPCAHEVAQISGASPKVNTNVYLQCNSSMTVSLKKHGYTVGILCELEKYQWCGNDQLVVSLGH